MFYRALRVSRWPLKAAGQILVCVSSTCYPPPKKIKLEKWNFNLCIHHASDHDLHHPPQCGPIMNHDPPGWGQLENVHIIPILLAVHCTRQMQAIIPVMKHGRSRWLVLETQRALVSYWNCLLHLEDFEQLLLNRICARQCRRRMV